MGGNGAHAPDGWFRTTLRMTAWAAMKQMVKMKFGSQETKTECEKCQQRKGGGESLGGLGQRMLLW